MNQEITGVIIPSVAPDGYSGAISMLVGVTRDGTLAGVRVLAHRETPGLGDKLDLSRDDWRLRFDGRAQGQPPAERWAGRKDGGDADRLTGATISPRAVGGPLRRTGQFGDEYGELWSSTTS